MVRWNSVLHTQKSISHLSQWMEFSFIQLLLFSIPYAICMHCFCIPINLIYSRITWSEIVLSFCSRISFICLVFIWNFALTKLEKRFLEMKHFIWWRLQLNLSIFLMENSYSNQISALYRTDCAFMRVCGQFLILPIQINQFSFRHIVKRKKNRLIALNWY